MFPFIEGVSFPRSATGRVLASCLFLVSCGCTGWARLNAGPVASLNNGPARSGAAVSTDVIFTAKPNSWFNAGRKPLPIGFHTGLTALATPDLKGIGWLTGVALFTPPRPITGYLIVGTNLHFDLIDSRFSAGNFHPYGEVGLAAPIGAAMTDNRRGPLLTMGFETQYLIHYAAILRSEGPRTDWMGAMKFGVGWEW